MDNTPGMTESKALDEFYNLAGSFQDPQELERQVMDPSAPKSEREWWASREIQALRGRLLAIVHASGGEVEGHPTGSHNILQRIRQLRQIEEARAPSGDDDEFLYALVLTLNRRLTLADSRLRAVVHHWNEFGPEHGFEETVRRAEVSLREEGLDQLTILRRPLVMIVEWFESLPNDELPDEDVRRAFAAIIRALGVPSK